MKIHQSPVISQGVAWERREDREAKILSGLERLLHDLEQSGHIQTARHISFIENGGAEDRSGKLYGCGGRFEAYAITDSEPDSEWLQFARMV